MADETDETDETDEADETSAAAGAEGATRFVPSEYMRAKRPHLFSDSPGRLVPKLDRGYLEYTLDTLTSRKQEQVFEEFSRRLLELEVCPNIKPQTGPTGGGDSKTDGSTYPVSSGLKLRSYWGLPGSPSSAKWAFAISCKREWKPKAKSDVAKIAQLPEAYEVIYFVTNQFVRDKDRADLERDLSQKHGREVHILERTWIVTKILEHGREALAIELLGLTQFKAEERPGPKDAARQQELDALLARVRDPMGNYGGNDYALAEDYLEAAMLARGLEKPRHEVEGLFRRARDLAKEAGTTSQIVKCGYDHAWTLLWWYDDPAKLLAVYEDLEPLLPSIYDADDCDSFSNLLQLLNGATIQGHLKAEDSRVGTRRVALKKELRRLASDPSRPNNALHAKTLGHLVDLSDIVDSFTNPENARSAFKGLRECLARSAGMGTYPAMDLIDSLSKMGEFFGRLPGYDQLFESMRRIATDRRGETAEGQLLLQRGLQVLKAGDAREALRFLGRARVKLTKQETLPLGVRAALATGAAYRSLGLLWAARNETLSATHLAHRAVSDLRELPPEGRLGLQRLCWLELELGRIGPFFAWQSAAWNVLLHLQVGGVDVEAASEDLRFQQGVFGCFLANAESISEADLRTLLSAVSTDDYLLARLAVLLRLGEHELIRKETDGAIDDPEEYARLLKEQPAAEQLPAGGLGFPTSPESHVVELYGVRYVVNSDTHTASVLFAENLLGALESLLALATWSNLAFVVEEVRVNITTSAQGSNPPGIELNRPASSTDYDVVWAEDALDWLQSADPRKYLEFLQKLLTKILLDVTIDPFKGLNEEFGRWAEADTFSLALASAPTAIAVCDILGRRPLGEDEVSE